MAKMVADRILLLNVHSSMNVGDEALLRSALRQLQVNFPESEITLSINELVSYTGHERGLPSIYSWVHPIDTRGGTNWKPGRLMWLVPATLFPILSQRWFKRALFWLTPKDLRPILSEYLQADLITGTPGGYLYSSGRGLSLLILLYSMQLAVLAGKPVYLMPQSIGPIRHRWEGWYLRWLLEKVRIVMVREPVSMQVVQACRVRNPRVHLIPDMAFALPAAAAEKAEGWLRGQGIDPEDGKPLLGITIVNWGEQNKRFARQEVYERACAAAARWFVEQHRGRVIFFPQVWGPTQNQDDRIPAQRVANQLQDLEGAIHCVVKPLPMDELKAVYGKMDLFIGTRMHSSIFALSEGVPAIAIGYQHKHRGIASMAGMSNWVIDIQQVDENILVERMTALWEQRGRLSEQLRQTIPGIIRQSEQVGILIRQDYDMLSQEHRK
jgi:colanic acid/amylovoran biosynthesis protein